MAADLITIIETVAVTQFLTPAAKNLGETVLARGKQMAGKAVAHLAAVGRQPQAVAEKLLVPILLGAGLESDPTLAELWAALLANAADPTQQAPVLPAFTTILREITAQDALVLQTVANYGRQAHDPAGGERRKDYVADWFLDATSLRFTGLLDVVPNFELSVDNLSRVNLCISLGDTVATQAAGISTHPLVNPHRPGKDTVAITTLGVAFLNAVTPPTP